MNPALAFLLGLLFGTIVGFFAAAMCAAAKRGDRDLERGQ